MIGYNSIHIYINVLVYLYILEEGPPPHRNNAGVHGTLHSFFALRKDATQGETLTFFVLKGLGEGASILMTSGCNSI